MSLCLRLYGQVFYIWVFGASATVAQCLVSLWTFAGQVAKSYSLKFAALLIRLAVAVLLFTLVFTGTLCMVRAKCCYYYYCYYYYCVSTVLQRSTNTHLLVVGLSTPVSVWRLADQRDVLVRRDVRLCASGGGHVVPRAHAH